MGQASVIRMMLTEINKRRATLHVTIEKYIIRGEGECTTTVCQHKSLAQILDQV